MHQVLDHCISISAAATKLTYLMSASIITISSLKLQEWGVLIGIILGILTFLTNLYFKWRTLKLQELKIKGEQDE